MVSSPLKLRIASRGSRLALWQSRSVQGALQAAHPALEIEIEVIRTTGDKILDVPLAKIGDRGLFTKEIDEALLDGRADLAVHSLKDIPTRIPDGLALAAVGEREDPRDVLIGPPGTRVSLQTLPGGSRIGTSSLRRRSQLGHLRSDLEVADLRGNLDTRLEKLDSGGYQAIILAAAGVLRLGLADRISEHLPLDRWLPAVGQGALGIVCRDSDANTRTFLEALNHPETFACVTAERAFLRSLEGGCQVPIGAHAVLADGTIRIDGFVSDLSGAEMLRESREGPVAAGDELGRALAQALIARGAAEILENVREASGAPKIPPP